MKTLVSVAGLLTLLCLLSLFGCGQSQERKAAEHSPQRPVVAVTILPEETFVREVGGELLDVVVLVPKGASPELYDPDPSIVRQMNDASLFFTLGLPVEQSKAIPQNASLRVVSLDERVRAVYPDLTFDDGSRDPHIWLSPKRVKVMIDVICEELSAFDPANSKQYRENADAYLRSLEETDRALKDAFKGLTDRRFIVYHPAFAYFAEEYGLTMYALEQEGKEATPRHLQEMIDIAKEQKIRVIFFQEESAGRQAETYAAEIGGVSVALSPLAADYTDNLVKMADAMVEVMQ